MGHYLGVQFMAFTRKNDEAVSPVIGVILMVAITVILAAVIAAFVFGMAGNISKTKVVAVSIKRVNSTSLSATYEGGQDAQSLGVVNFTVNGGAPSITGSQMGTSGTSSALPIGTSTTIGVVPAGAHVIALGSFLDGSTQVLYDSTI